MSDLRGRHGRNFSGCYIQIAGDDAKLNTYLNQLEFVSGCMVLGRADTTEGHGVLFIHVRKEAVKRLHTIAKECGLSAVV